MYKQIKFLSFLILASILIVACDKDDDNPTCSDGIMNGTETGVDCGGSCEPCVDPSELTGEISEDKILDSAIEYSLTGALVVKAPATLTIPAGTVIKATGGTSSYIAVAQGAMINVNGTASNPVVMTSGSDSPQQGDWGGLVIAGKAPTNKGATPTTEVGDLSYGGTEVNDNSGIIKYLRVEYTGATFTNEKEFNGVSLFGVGSGTTFEYVQAYEAGDDGIEFFGGTVNGSNLVVTNSGDDGIDFADGWNGNGTNWYISGAAKGAIEGSNNGDNGDATPTTTTTLTNITVVGPVSEGALYYKEGGGNFTIDNFYAYNVDLGIKWKDTDTPAVTRVTNGDLVITNMQFANNVDGFEYSSAGADKPSWLGTGIATGAGNGSGAPSWTAGWTLGLSNSNVSTTENLEGEITGDVSLSADKEYLLTSGFVVKDGGTLNIPAGTVIKATGGTSSYIAVAQGGKINVNGTATSPVVMTSGASNPQAGDWGGLVIAGKAPTNKGATPTTEVGDLSYGGTTSNDNSGSIRYLRVEYTGATFTNEKEFNGVSLFGVGSGTTFEYVEAFEAGDDGIEFFGGTVDGDYLVITNSYDDGIDFADGWNGNGTNWYIKGAAKGAIEGSNNGDNGNATPTTTTTLTNITVVGPVSEGALYYKEGGGNFTVDNMFVSGANLGVKWKTTDAPAVARVGNGDLTVDVKFADNVTGFIYNTGGDATNAPSWMTIDDSNTGAGNGADKPDWMTGWTK